MSAQTDTPGKIWVRAPNWVGDAVMATPALRALRHAQPNAEITVCGAPHLGALFDAHPNVDEFLPVHAKGWGGLRKTVGEIKERAPGWAVVFPDSSRSALPSFLAGVPTRAGYAREPLRRILVNRRLPLPKDTSGRRAPISMVERYLRITRALGCEDRGLHTDLPIDRAARERLRERLSDFGLAGDSRYFVITPGASFGSSKLWPAEHFAAAADQLAGSLEATCVIAPGPGEEEIAAAIEAIMVRSAVNLVHPSTDLAELVVLLSDAVLLVSNDTGPRHIAVARETPVVCVMGSTDPRHTEHLMERQRVLREEVECSPCHKKVCPIDHRCMTRLLPSRVVAAAEELLT